MIPTQPVPAAMPGESARAAALAALLDLAAHDRTLPADALRALGDWCDAWQPATPPKAIIGRACPMPAARWHLDRLREGHGEAGAELRRAFHARMLGNFLAPGRDDFRPLVTVVIPVFNRAGMVVEAVESCLAQDWRPLEILVVDDGSTDDPAAALRRFGDRVRVLRQANSGVSCARNAGIAAARGDFIHFLDSDNLLLPDAVSAKVAAFRAIPDAAICFGGAVVERDGRRLPNAARIPDGGPACPTADLLRVAAQRIPFFVSSVMMPRWAILRAGGFEEDLRRTEDYRFWITLGLSGAKAIAVDQLSVVRRRPKESLHRQRHHDQGPDIVAALRSLGEILQRPEHWICAHALLARVAAHHDRPIAAASLPLVAAEISRFGLLGEVLCGCRTIEGRSALLILASLRHDLAHYVAIADPASPLAAMAAGLLPRIARAIAVSPSLTARDCGDWPSQSGPIAERNPLWRFLKRIAEAVDDPAERCSVATTLLRRMPRLPKRREIARYLRLRRTFGLAVAYLWLRLRAWRRRPWRHGVQSGRNG